MTHRITMFALLLAAGLAHALEAPQLSLSTQYNPELDCVQVQLSWPSVSGAEVYEVYYRDPRNAAWQTDSLLTTTTNCAYSLRVPMIQIGRVRPNVARLFSVRAVLSPLVLVPAGSFLMGQVGVSEPEHTATLTQDFYLGRYEVTNQEYMEALQWAYDQGLVTVTDTRVEADGAGLLAIGDVESCEIAFDSSLQQFTLVPRTTNTGTFGPGFAYPEGYDPAHHPVKDVSWYGAACYCDWRSMREGLPAFYQGNWNQSASHDPYLAQGYRLPTEAEWEYAAQFNDERTYPWGDQSPSCEVVNCFLGSSFCVGWTTPVGGYPATGLGFYDLGGNVSEWCGDWFGSYSSDSVSNPTGPPSGSLRVSRDSSWGNNASYLLCASRHFAAPSVAFSRMGFRVCRTANP